MNLSSKFLRRVVWTALPAALVALPMAAQMPADALFSGFKPSGDFLLDLDGKEMRDAEIFLSDKAGAYLILGPSLSSPLLINTRTQKVESVSLLKVQRNPNKTIDLLADATFDEVDRFVISGQKLTFKVKGKEAVLRQRPPLLGMQTPDSLIRNKPDYGFKSDEYHTDPAIVAALKAEKRNVRIRVYFGTWCPTCSRLVPRVLKTESELKGSKLTFEYYGLPQPMTDDPVTAREKLNGVPTVIVYVDGVEKGRVDVGALAQPEKALQDMLGG